MQESCINRRLGIEDILAALSRILHEVGPPWMSWSGYVVPLMVFEIAMVNSF